MNNLIYAVTDRDIFVRKYTRSGSKNKNRLQSLLFSDFCQSQVVLGWCRIYEFLFMAESQRR